MDHTIPPAFRQEITGSKRFVSALIDYLPMLVISIIASIPATILYITSLMEVIPELESTDPSDAAYAMELMFGGMMPMLSVSIIGMIVSYTYFLCKDIFRGRSIGKRSQGLQLVMKKDGGPVSYARMVLRNLTIIIWFVELVVMLVNPKQRLGDMICGTTVVYADQSNRQETDKSKAALTIGIVFIALCLFGFLYYKFFQVFFEFYINLLSNIGTGY